ncbi:MAG: DUF3857 domain-containing transglutaminase family protein [Candidatus Zixiibacteriota bacterium]
MRKVFLITSVILLIAAGLAFADALQLHEDEDIRGENITFENGNFKVGNKSIDREKVKKLLTTDATMDSPYDLSKYELTDDKIAEYRGIAAEMEEKYPVANGYVLRNEDRNILTSDGRELSFSEITIKINSQDAMDWGNYSFYIDEGINEVDILYARSIQPDGSITSYSIEDITWSEPSRDAQFFGKGKIMSMTVPGLEVGSILDVGYVKETYAPEDPELFTAMGGFQFSEPIYKTEFQVEVPKDRELYYTSQYMDAYFKENWATNIETIDLPQSEFEQPTRPEIEETDSSKIYTWVKEDVPPIISEPKMQSTMNVTPLVWSGLHSNYEYYFDRFGKLHKEHMKLTPTLDSLAKAIVGDAQTDSAKVAKLYHWVQSNIRYISVKGALASRFGGHYASLTHENKYGDCSDKAIYFATLCEAVGIRAYPIIVLTNDAGFVPRDKFPYWGGNHAINEVWIDGEPRMLDATNNYFRYPYYPSNDCDLWYVNYVDRRVVYQPPHDPSYNAMRSRTFVKVENDGTANINDSLYLTGQFEAGYRGHFDRAPEDRHKQIIENIASSRNPGSKLSDFELYNIKDMSKQFSMQFQYDVSDYIKKAGDYYLLEVPALRYTFPEIALGERNYPIKLDFPFQRQHDVTFEIPDEMVAEFMPNKIEVENEYFEYQAQYEKVGNKIRFTDEYNIKKIRIPVEDYDKYKEDAEEIMAFVKEKIFLKKS